MSRGKELRIAPPPRRNDAGAHLPSLFPFSQTGEGVERRSASHLNSTPGEACAPNNVGRTPTGAPPRCFYSRRAVLPHRTGAPHAPFIQRSITSAFSPVRAACLHGNAASSRKPTDLPPRQSVPGLRGPAYWSPLPAPLHERLMKAPSTGRDATYVTRGIRSVKRCVPKSVVQGI